MMSKLDDGTVEGAADDGNKGDEGGKNNKKKGGISAKDIAKNPAMAKMFVLAAKKFKAVQERERLEAEEKEKATAAK
jgi:hypothetical protein